MGNGGTGGQSDWKDTERKSNNGRKRPIGLQTRNTQHTHATTATCTHSNNTTELYQAPVPIENNYILHYSVETSYWPL